ncbi:hypothetical protein PHLGIDRAFT_62635 [Phlebiopsis gigantea 11061_1 CR5-6]|uniref:AB hydrolase-1 domain-containing protein n=1 Tax=Phlebiopsis gigantea (strain 11061_1 CR5-6) TaxID=745531 RepID=A0A0C3S6V2_PHLG1|nr:hypothetical protein PHLGIDRAFT_62635 [Phlebiopsis gigantea 11061_1 CR5-6]
MSITLPEFLEPYDHQLPGEPSTQPVKYRAALFRHKRIPSTAHAFWWPAQTGSNGQTCFVFVPGNPGLLDWYTPFLAALYEKSQGRLNILAHALVGHTPNLQSCHENISATTLSAQVEHLLEVVDAVKDRYDHVVLAGHSVGSWIALQALKQRNQSINAIFLLFPTISGIADTPNAHRLSPLFKAPIPRIVAWLSPLTRLIPDRIFAWMYSDWPEAQRAVLKSLTTSPSTVYAALSMAHEEMRDIKSLDGDLLLRHKHRLHLYFAEQDDWVGKNKDAIIKVFCDEPDAIKIVHGRQDIPHAFCISE